MKGLLIKDFLTLAKQMKLFLLIIVVFACLPGFSAVSFALVYSAMLPVTALAYDERSKWDNLAVMMPYSPGQLVFSKYVLGYAAVIGAAVISVIAQTAISLISGAQFGGAKATLFLMSCLALAIQSLCLPVMFKLGVEKGRFMFMVLIMVFAAGTMALSDKASALIAPANADLGGAMAVALLITLALNVISIRFSTAAFIKKGE